MTDFTIIPAQEAESIRRGVSVLWFDRLMDGAMLLMKKRPVLSKPMREAMDEEAVKMRTKAASPEGFYVWFEGLPDSSPTAQEEEGDFDPLAEVG